MFGWSKPPPIATQVRISGTLHAPRRICKIGVFYDSIEETLAQNGFALNRVRHANGVEHRKAA